MRLNCLPILKTESFSNRKHVPLNARIVVNSMIRKALSIQVLLAATLVMPLLPGMQTMSPAAEQIVQITGKVVGVTDGDTVTLRTEDQTLKVRLTGIDTPERGQPFGTRAKQALSGKVFGKTISLNSSGEDRYERTLGEIMLDGSSINEWLVREGMAWWYERYAPRETRLRDAQQEAQQARRGLWADPEPVPPWEWRRGKR
jgi:micrococcal nuclease